MPSTATARPLSIEQTLRDQIRVKLQQSNYAVEEAILRLYDRQEADEQNSQVTVHANGIGFNAFDAGILSSFAEQIRADATRARPFGKGRRLSEKQMKIARRKIMRYVGQLTDIAMMKAHREAEIEVLNPCLGQCGALEQTPGGRFCSQECYTAYKYSGDDREDTQW